LLSITILGNKIIGEVKLLIYLSYSSKYIPDEISDGIF